MLLFSCEYSLRFLFGYKRQSEIQKGFAIAPVWLNLEGKDPALVGLGSYIVNAQARCNDCHTCPSYDPSAYEGHPQGHNPFPPPFGDLGDGKINSQKYLPGGFWAAAQYGRRYIRQSQPRCDGKTRWANVRTV
jgi:hypothetical protein